MIQIKTPCMNCSRRVLGCHSTCEDFAAYQAEKEEIQKRITQEKNVDRTELEGKLYSLRKRGFKKFEW